MSRKCTANLVFIASFFSVSLLKRTSHVEARVRDRHYDSAHRCCIRCQAQFWFSHCLPYSWQPLLSPLVVCDTCNTRKPLQGIGYSGNCVNGIIIVCLLYCIICVRCWPCPAMVLYGVWWWTWTTKCLNKCPSTVCLLVLFKLQISASCQVDVAAACSISL